MHADSVNLIGTVGSVTETPLLAAHTTAVALPLRDLQMKTPCTLRAVKSFFGGALRKPLNVGYGLAGKTPTDTGE